MTSLLSIVLVLFSTAPAFAEKRACSIGVEYHLYAVEGRAKDGAFVYSGPRVSPPQASLTVPEENALDCFHRAIRVARRTQLMGFAEGITNNGRGKVLTLYVQYFHWNYDESSYVSRHSSGRITRYTATDTTPFLGDLAQAPDGRFVRNLNLLNPRDLLDSLVPVNGLQNAKQLQALDDVLRSQVNPAPPVDWAFR